MSAGVILLFCEANTRTIQSVDLPETRYAQSGDVSIAYVVEGDGPVDLVWVHGYAGNIEVEAEDPHSWPMRG